jgi:hypothetical protein
LKKSLYNDVARCYALLHNNAEEQFTGEEVPLGRIRSRKALLLGEAFGQHWWLVALDWENRPLGQAEIARAWEEAVKHIDPSVTYNQQDVSYVMRLARVKVQEPGAVALAGASG